MGFHDAFDGLVSPGDHLRESPARLLDDRRLARVLLDELVSNRQLQATIEDQEGRPSGRRPVDAQQFSQPDGDFRRQNALHHPPPEHRLNMQTPLGLILNRARRIDLPRRHPPRPDLIQPDLPRIWINVVAPVPVSLHPVRMPKRRSLRVESLRPLVPPRIDPNPKPTLPPAPPLLVPLPLHRPIRQRHRPSPLILRKRHHNLQARQTRRCSTHGGMALLLVSVCA